MKKSSESISNRNRGKERVLLKKFDLVENREERRTFVEIFSANSKPQKMKNRLYNES